MSLKAKLEAVIYAAEEPVTLAQLSVLFTHEALEWKAEQEAARAAAAAEQPQTSGQGLPLLNEAFNYLELDQSDPTGAPDEAAQAEAGSSVPDATPPADAEAPEAGPPSDEIQNASPSEADLKRLARLRDREVRAILRGLIDDLIAVYASDDRGVEIREIAGGYRMATKPECHDAVRMFVKSLKPALKLSLPALETLAVIAYKQPVTAPEVNEIRGVDSSAVFGSLLARKLIATAGRKQVIGRPILYKTTREFLLRFGLKDVNELPSMEEFEKMAALEFDEAESASEPQQEPAAELDLALEVETDLALEVEEAGIEEAEGESSALSPQQVEAPETAGRADSNETESEEEPVSTDSRIT